MYCTQQVLIEPTVGLASKHTSTVATNKKPGKSKQNETSTTQHCPKPVRSNSGLGLGTNYCRPDKAFVILGLEFAFFLVVGALLFKLAK